MQNQPTGSITEMFQRLRDGDTESARQLWDRFFPRLIGLARKVLAGRELPVDAEDAVLQAFYKFFQRVERGQVDDGLQRDELWRLLSTTTAQIASKQRRSERTQKRGGGRVKLETELAENAAGEFDLDEMLGAVPPPDCDLICEELLNCLDADVREIAVLRLAGYTNAEIKEIAGYPLRSIERRMQLIRAVWSTQANDSIR